MAGISIKRGKHKHQYLTRLRNERGRASFLLRYGMTRQEWAAQKKEWRSKGEGFKIDELMTKAYQLFLKSILNQNANISEKRKVIF